MTFWSTKIIFTHKTVWKLFWCLYRWQATQLLTFTCSKSTIEALEKGVKYVQSWQWRHHNDARTPMPKCDFNKVDLHFYWNRTSAWVFCSRSGDFIVNFKHISNLLLFFSFFFVTAIWLPLDQLWAILKGTASQARCYSLNFLTFSTRRLPEAS